MAIKSTVFLTFSLFIIYGCGNPFGDMTSTVDTNYGLSPIVVVPSATGFEVISGAKSEVTTTSGRKVDISAGQAAGALKLTTSQNRTALINVQGQMYE